MAVDAQPDARFSTGQKSLKRPSESPPAECPVGWDMGAGCCAQSTQAPTDGPSSSMDQVAAAADQQQSAVAANLLCASNPLIASSQSLNAKSAIETPDFLLGQCISGKWRHLTNFSRLAAHTL